MFSAPSSPTLQRCRGRWPKDISWQALHPNDPKTSRLDLCLNRRMSFPDYACSIVASGSFVGGWHENLFTRSKLGGLPRDVCEMLGRNPGYSSVDPLVW